MIRKIVAIKNVGRFRSYSATGDVEFKRLTIFFGENGRGKTTLSAIFRSLKTGVATHVIERRTIGSADQPHVHLLMRAGSAEFNNGAWTGSFGDIEVFDETFVHRNVYAGDCIDHDHKKNLYRVIVGEEGVALAREVDSLDGKIRDANKQIGELKEAVTRSCPGGMDLDTFVGLTPVNRLDEQIAALEAEIAGLGQQIEIRLRKPLDRVMLPQLPAEVTAVLAKDIDGASGDVEVLVRGHIAKCAAGLGEAWLTEGLPFVKDDACPFCGTDLASNKLLAAYRVYFGEVYRTIKEQVSDARRGVEDALGTGALLRLQKRLGENLTLQKFWNPLTGLDLPDLSFDSVRGVLERLRNAAGEALGRKAGQILEAVAPGPEFDAAIATWRGVTSLVIEYNRVAETINAAIAKLKAAGGADAGELRARLATLQVVKLRHSPAVAEICIKYHDAVLAKKKLDAEKKQAKKKLDDYTTTIFENYQSTINDLLGQFNAGFRIDKTKGRYVGGSPSSTFVLVINDAAIDLDDDKASPGNPCFKNTLSAGDRSALALAFFVARLHHDPRIAYKIVVIDDPITSQDMFRVTCTRQLISRLYTTAKQVVVLSHCPLFLRNLWENSASRDVKALQISRDGDHSTLAEWDVENDTRGEYYQNYHDLTRYLATGDGEKRHVARCIRVLLEEYMRLKAPQQFRRGEWLGTFVEKIRAAQPGEVLFGAKPVLVDLEDINEYSKRYHHRENPGADGEPITDGELQGYVRRTIDLVSKF
jgi:wobble nucleotide-excising tRNase